MDPILASHAAIVEGIEVMVGWQSHHRTRRSGLALMTAGSSRFPTPYSNAAFPLDTPSPGELFDQARDFFADRRYVLWARMERDRALIESAVHREFIALGDEPGMAIESPVAPTELPKPLSIEQVSSPGTLAELVHICQQAYAEVGLPAEIGAKLFANVDAVLGCGATLALARWEGKAISAALSVVAPQSELGGVYWVATLPAERKKGAARAVTRFVTNAAFDRGARIVTLQASRAGEPIYKQMGYREVVRYARFLSPRLEKP